MPSNFFFLVFFIGLIESKVDETRSLSIEYLYPKNDSTPYCSNLTCVNVVHTTARGSHDDIHYLYTTLGLPSILAIKTSKNASLKIDWEKFLSSNITQQESSVKFSDEETKIFSSALLMFNKMIIFNDPSDKANMSDKSVNKLVKIGMGDLYWLAASQSTKDVLAVEFVSKMMAPNNKTQEISIKLKASSGFEPSTVDLPHLLLNDNLTQIDVTFKDVYYGYEGDDDVINEKSHSIGNTTKITNPRIALEIQMLTPKSAFVTSYVSVEKSVDDELSPGAFRTVNWLSDEISNSTSLKQGTFVQWKPICYTNSEKSITSVTRVTNYEINKLNFNDGQHIPVSMATGFYGVGSLSEETMNMAGLNVSFGATADKFYSETGFLTWQLTFGIGQHPQNGISKLTIIIIAVGLGIPALFLLAAIIYLPIRSCHLKRRRGYEELSSSYPQII